MERALCGATRKLRRTLTQRGMTREQAKKLSFRGGHFCLKRITQWLGFATVSSLQQWRVQVKWEQHAPARRLRGLPAVGPRRRRCVCTIFCFEPSLSSLCMLFWPMDMHNCVCCRSADVCDQPPALAHAHHPIAHAVDSSGRSDSENERSTLPRPPERAVASRDLESTPPSPPPKRLLHRSDRTSGHVHRDGGGEDAQSPPQRMFERIVQPQLRQVGASDASDCGRRLLLRTLERPSQ